MLPPLLLLRKQARDAQLCRQGAIFHSATIVVGHCHPQCVVCATDIVTITQQGEERAMCQGTTIHTVAAFHHCASLDTPLQLLRSHVTARNAQQCQGTFIHTATTLVVPPIVAWLLSLLPTEKGKEWPTMPRHHCPLCCICLRYCHCHYHMSEQVLANNGGKAPSSACHRCPHALSSALCIEPSSG